MQSCSRLCQRILRTGTSIWPIVYSFVLDLLVAGLLIHQDDPERNFAGSGVARWAGGRQDPALAGMAACWVAPDAGIDLGLAQYGFV